MSGSCQFPALPHLRTEIDHAGRDVLVEIDGVSFQFSDFEEHFEDLRAPN
jgi:hypothetical protein